MFGKQPLPLEGTDGATTIWVMPSSSARCAQLPRAVDKVPFFAALRRYLDFLKGLTEEPHEEEIVFANVVLKNQPKKIKTEVKTEQEEEEGGATAEGASSTPEHTSEGQNGRPVQDGQWLPTSQSVQQQQNGVIATADPNFRFFIKQEADA